MKKYILTFFVLATLLSCHTDQDYENLNIDSKSPTVVPANFLFTGATVRLARQMASPNVNLNISRFVSQYLTATTYLDEPNYDLNNRNISQNHWSALYRTVIYDLQDAKRFLEDDTTISEEDRATRMGQIEVIEVYAWHILVDTFGDIPYSEALDPEGNTLPAYDDAATIYEDLITRLGNAAGNLEGGQGFPADPVYGGNVGNWHTFANSLQLRLAMRIADSNPGLSQSAAEAAVSRGVFDSNDESATVAFDENPPYTNPLWNDLVQSGRSDYVAANTLVDYMNDLEDPRRTTYFNENLGEGVYRGGTYGASSAYGSHTHVGDRFLDPTLPGILQDYVEVQFHLAEAAQRGYSVGGDAESFYNEAITASILFYGGTEEEAEEYLSQGDVRYSAANWRERIGTQFWLAMFDNPFEGWAVWRKFDAPQLNIAAQSQRPVPLRFTYPINEQNLNEANYQAASSAIGGDDQQTALFWDRN
jgi:hypothetical protein